MIARTFYITFHFIQSKKSVRRILVIIVMIVSHFSQKDAS